MIGSQPLRRLVRGSRTTVLAASLVLTGFAALPDAAGADRDDRGGRGDRGRGRWHERDDDRRDGRRGRGHDRDRWRDHGRDRRHSERGRRPHYDRGHHHRGPHRVFVAPRVIHDFGVYRPYYHSRIFFPAHHHQHVVYAFPVDVGYGPVYRPYAYCDGHLFAGGHFTDYPRFSLNIRF